MFLSKDNNCCGKSGSCSVRLLWMAAQLGAENGGDGKDHVNEDDPSKLL